MDIEAQALIEELLEINKQQTLQIAMLKAMIKNLQADRQPSLEDTQLSQ
jgi:hypothetical protein